MKHAPRWCGYGLLLAGAAGALAWTAGQFARVQVKEAVLRQSPDYFLGKPLGVAPYDAKAKIVEVRGAWLKVNVDNLPEGWLNESSLYLTKAALQSGENPENINAAESELSLAGRGFNKDLEQEYRSGASGGVDFPSVDRIETDPAYRIADEKLLPFLDLGGLAKKGGTR